MRLKDNFQLSINSIFHRRLRSWLTLLGIVIGVAAVVAIVSIGAGAQASVNAQLSRFGADIISISPGFNRSQQFGGFARDLGGGGRETVRTSSGAIETPTLKPLDATIIRGNPNVVAINEIVSGRSDIYFLAEKSSASIQGINPDGFKQTSNLTLASGRFLTPSDTTAVVVGDRVANQSFKAPLTIGRRLVIDNYPFTVVGILQATGNGFGGGGGDGTVYMSHDSAWNVLSADVNRNTFSSIQAKVRDASLITQVTADLTQSLMVERKVTEKTQNFTITSSQAIQSQVSSVTDTLTLFLGAIAAISLIVGAIGIANSMFTSVLEKTKEIGVLKALGSTNGEILTMFIIESGLFGFLGGILGVGLGALASEAMSGVISLPVPGTGRGGMLTYVSPQLMVFAIILSTLIGILAGVFPAQNASKMKPVDALRYE